MTTSQRRSLLCPRCRKLISSDEPTCPHCGLSKPGSALKRSFYKIGFQDTDTIIRTIIYLNIGMFAVSLLLNPRAMGMHLNPFTFLSPSDRALLLLGATGTIPIDQLGRWWTLVSANYLHGSILHIFFNMVALRQLAPLVIGEYGASRMVVIYTAGGIIGFWVSYWAGVRLTIGASAAVCALIGSLLFYGRSRGGLYGSMMYRQIGGWALGIFLFGLLVPGINNWGHGGGMVAGALLGFLLGYQEKRRESSMHRVLSGGVMLITLCILGWAVFSGAYYNFS
jgi:rhomboid protease GluP